MLGQVLGDGEGFKATASQAMEIDDAFFCIFVHFIGVFVSAMTEEGAFEFLLTVVGDFGEIFDVEEVLVEVVGWVGEGVRMHYSE